MIPSFQPLMYYGVLLFNAVFVKKVCPLVKFLLKIFFPLHIKRACFYFYK